MLLLIEAAQTLFHRLGPVLDVEGVLGDFPGDAWHICRSPCKSIFVAPEEVHELAFLFRAPTGPDLDDLGRVLSIDMDSISVLGSLEGARHGGHGWASQRGLCVVAQLLQLDGSDHGSDQLDDALLAIQCLMGLGPTMMMLVGPSIFSLR
jgi:hypothetical protein